MRYVETQLTLRRYGITYKRHMSLSMGISDEIEDATIAKLWWNKDLRDWSNDLEIIVFLASQTQRIDEENCTSFDPQSNQKCRNFKVIRKG